MNIIGVVIGGDLVRLRQSGYMPYILSSVPLATLALPGTNAGGPFIDLTAYSDPTQGRYVHLVAVAQEGALIHSYLESNPEDPPSWTWSTPEIIKPTNIVQPAPRYRFTRADCFHLSGTLHVAAVTVDSGLVYVSSSGGSWSSFLDVKAEAQSPDFFQDVAIRVDQNDNIDFLAVTNDGRLVHGVRAPFGNWTTPLRDLAAVSTPVVSGKLRRVAAEVVRGGVSGNGELHVVAIHDMGHILHTVRSAAGVFHPVMGDVQAQAGSINAAYDLALTPGTFGGLSVGILSTNGALQLTWRDTGSGRWDQFRNPLTGWHFGNLAFSGQPVFERVP